MKKIGAAAAALAVALSVPALTRADIVINAVESSGNVVFSYSGHIDLTGLGSPNFTFVDEIHIVSPDSGIGTGSVTFLAPGTIVDSWVGPYSFPVFGVLGFSIADSVTGPGLAMYSDGFGIFDGYVSGAPISGDMTFLGDTFASLGATPGIYVANLPSDTVTLIIGPAQVPEPATLALLGIALAGLAFRRRKRVN